RPPSSGTTGRPRPGAPWPSPEPATGRRRDSCAEPGPGPVPAPVPRCRAGQLRTGSPGSCRVPAENAILTAAPVRSCAAARGRPDPPPRRETTKRSAGPSFHAVLAEMAGNLLRGNFRAIRAWQGTQLPPLVTEGMAGIVAYAHVMAGELDRAAALAQPWL